MEKTRSILAAVFGTCLLAGITEELIFRGFIMRLPEIRWNKAIAVIAPSVLFGALHITNMSAPNFQDIMLLLLAGSCVGVMFSLIAMQSGSVWASAAVHGVLNLVIVGGILEIGAQPTSALFTYTLTAKGIEPGCV